MIIWIHKLLEIFNIKGGPLMGFWTLTIIFRLVTGEDITVAHRDIYLGALAVYGVSKGHAMRVDKLSSVKKIQEEGDV